LEYRLPKDLVQGDEWEGLPDKVFVKEDAVVEGMEVVA
jgi:hypothetical protein